jgi:hypothetical protein
MGYWPLLCALGCVALVALAATARTRLRPCAWRQPPHCENNFNHRWTMSRRCAAQGRGDGGGIRKKAGAVMAVTAGLLKNLGSSMGLVQADFYRSSGSSQGQVDRRDFLNINILKLQQPVDMIFRIR